jgi:indolepyruvate ferredoxin oxidoreductase alpha subunit
MLEPSTPQEARTFTIEGLKASEKFRLPFLLRTTTRLSHMRGVVETGELKPTKPKGEFTDKKGYVVVPKVAKQKHVQLLKKLEEVEKFANESSLNRIEKFGKSEKGIICSGISFTYVLEAIKDFGFECNVLKLGLNNPLPRKLVADFLKEHEQILVIEELEPILETEIKALAHELGINTVIYGKGPELHRYWEYDQGMINKALQNFFGKKQTVFAGRKPELSLPPRSPQLCPGCPHRSTYYAVKKVAPKNTIYPTDIGCYTLGIEDPLNIADYLLCMGSSIGTANGFSAVTGQPVVAFLGDSTFFHAGMPALVNATHHSRDMVVCILDNRTTAMTGHQPNPGIEIDGMGRAAKAIDLVEVAKGLGVEQVDRVNPMNLRATMDVFRRSLASKGTSVVVAKSPCILLERRALRQKGKELPVYQVDQSKCNSCRVCIDELGCPAFYKDEKGIWIDETLCNGCSFCIQVCESKAIRRVKK